MTLIRPNSQSDKTTQILNLLGSGLDRYSQGKRERQKSFIESEKNRRAAEEAERKKKAALIAGKIDKLKLDKAQEEQDVYSRIADIEAAGEGSEPVAGVEGPPAPDVMAQRSMNKGLLSKLKAKYSRLTGRKADVPEALSGDMTAEQAKESMASGKTFTPEQRTLLSGTAFPRKSFGEEFAKGLVKVEQMKILGEEAKVKGKLQQQSVNLKRDLGKTLNAFGLMWKKKKQQLAEGFKGGGVVGRGVKTIAGEVLKPESLPATQEYKGQLVETALSQNRIITGSVRVVQSVFEKLIESYPSRLDGDRVSVGKIVQSSRNTMGMAKAARDRGLQEEVRLIERNNPAALEDVNSEINKKFEALLPAALDLSDEIEVQKGLKRVFGEDYEKNKETMIRESPYGDVSNIKPDQVDDLEELIRRATEEGDEQAERAVRTFLPGIVL